MFLILAFSFEDHKLQFNIFPETSGGYTLTWLNLIQTGIFSSTPFLIIAACLRYDYSSSISSIALPKTSSDTPAADSFITTGENVKGDGVVKITISRPTRDEFRFNKPYFLTAMLGYLATYLILAVAVVLSKSDFPPMSSGLFASYMSPIVMTVMIGALAVFRQETKKLWAYREDWFIKPQPATAAESKAVGETKDENEKGDLMA